MILSTSVRESSRWGQPDPSLQVPGPSTEGNKGIVTGLKRPQDPSRLPWRLLMQAVKYWGQNAETNPKIYVVYRVYHGISLINAHQIHEVKMQCICSIIQVGSISHYKHLAAAILLDFNARHFPGHAGHPERSHSGRAGFSSHLGRIQPQQPILLPRTKGSAKQKNAVHTHTQYVYIYIYIAILI